MKTKQTKKTGYWPGMFVPIIAVAVVLMTFVIKADSADEISGCANNPFKSYGGIFDPADFALDDVAAGTGLTLETGKDAIDPNSIIIPKEQEVWATYFFEGAGYNSDFGWFLYSDAVDDKGTEDKSDDTFIGWDALRAKDTAKGAKSVIHPIFINIQDQSKDSDWEKAKNREGVLNTDYGAGSFPNNNETSLKTYNDGSDIFFVVDGDGAVTPLDMRKSLGSGAKFAPGTEIVFFLASNHRWNTSGNVFYTKSNWNPDTYEMKWKYEADVGTSTGKISNTACTSLCGNANNNTNNACFNACFIEAQLETLLKTTGAWSISNRMVPLDSEVAADANSPGWLDWTRSDYTYNAYSIKYKTADSNDWKNYSDISDGSKGKITKITLESKFNPIDPPGDDIGPAVGNRRFKLGESGGEAWKTDYGWLTANAVKNMNEIFGVYLDKDDTRTITLTNGKKYPHVIVGSPKDDPDQWVLGWDDQPGTGWTDTDFNDMVFRIELEAMGVAQLTAEKAITPDDPELNYNSVTIRVKDCMPVCGTAVTNIDYYIALDGGATDESWIKVEWSTVKAYDTKDTASIADDTVGSKVENWKPGTPSCTFREGRIDFGELGLSGNQLVWKAELRSTLETCLPTIIDVELQGDVARNAVFSRSSPIVRTNVVYSGTYETPAADWTDKYMRGHVVATRTYDPANPGEKETGESVTNAVELWDAGVTMNTQEPSARKIYFPEIVYQEVKTKPEVIGTRLVKKGVYEGTIAHTVIQPGTLFITDGVETFSDSHTSQLVGDKGGTGWINRFTGDYTLTFAGTGTAGDNITATYKYYETKGLKDFTTANVNAAMLNLTDEYVIGDSGKEYKDDLDGDGAFDATKDSAFLVNWTRGYKDGNTTKKPWLLGAIDHSAPAIAHAPGKPSWYESLGDTEKEAYKTFVKTHKNRQSLVLIGARDGMLHAFDAGHFRWFNDKIDSVNLDEIEAMNTARVFDNPKLPDMDIYRGYFDWGKDAETDLEDKAYTYGTGKEEWAFIPANLISRLKNNFKKSGAQAFVDASPAVSDVYVDSAWKSLVFSALGNGGDTIFCLDITSPLVPKLMWEFIDPDLYRSKSSPAVGQVGKVLVGGKSKWVVFFVSGTPTNCDGTDTDPHCYPSVFMIDAADGRVITRIFLDSEVEGKGGVPSGQPGVVDYDNNGYLDAMYVGTDKGFMYKVTLPDESGSLADIDDCVINDKVLPIYASPTIVVTEDGGTKYVDIFFGTSDNPYESGDSPAGTIYTFYAYRDSSGKGGCSKAEKRWWLDMPAGHRIFATAFAAAGKVYFGTSTQDTEDPCSTPDVEDAGLGRVYMVDQNREDGDPVSYIEVGNVRSAPVVDDEHLYIKTLDGAADGASGHMLSIGAGIYNNEPNKVQFSGPPTPQIKWWREVTEKVIEEE